MANTDFFQGITFYENMGKKPNNWYISIGGVISGYGYDLKKDGSITSLLKTSHDNQLNTNYPHMSTSEGFGLLLTTSDMLTSNRSSNTLVSDSCWTYHLPHQTDVFWYNLWQNKPNDSNCLGWFFAQQWLILFRSVFKRQLWVSRFKDYWCHWFCGSVVLWFWLWFCLWVTIIINF